MNKVMVVNKNTKVFLYNKPTSMVYGFPGLIQFIVKSGIPEYELKVGNVFLFLNKDQNYIKILFKTAGGFCLLAKRLVKGKFLINLEQGSIAATELENLITKEPKKVLKEK